MKIVIDIPKDMYISAKSGYLCGSEIIVNAIKYGTPFDSVIEDIKAEIQNLIDDTDSIYGTSALHSVLDIIDSIGKAESDSYMKNVRRDCGLYE